MIALVYRPVVTKAALLALELHEKLHRLGRANALVANSPEEPGVLPAETSLILSLGGDGTMLGAFRMWAEQRLDTSVPIIGVNLGDLGFLTAITPPEMETCLQTILSGRFPTGLRTLLKVEIQGEKYFVLNEAVVAKSVLAPLLDLQVRANQAQLVNLRADGLIVATPTGSSAYNLSAGGPICHPDLDCLILTPICSFNFSNRSLLMPPDMVLSVHNLSPDGQASLMCDGQVGRALERGAIVRISRARRQARLGAVHDYFEILRSKLKWG